jgi:uncharacterized membrane protein
MMGTVAARIAGLHTASAAPGFLAILAVHVTAALVAGGCGAWLAARRKGDRRHRDTGRVYVLALTVVALTTLGLSAFDIGRDWPLDALGVLAAGLAWAGIAHRRRHRPGDTGHILAMGGSYVLMLTAFYVDNGKSLPLWRDLPVLAYWLLPAAVGAPLIARAIARHRTAPLPGPGQPGAAPGARR